MALFKDSTETVFDLSEIRPGCLVWARHGSWDEGKAGFVTAARPDRIVVHYFPGIGNVTDHFIIRASEREGWEIRWSYDLAEAWGHPEADGSLSGEGGSGQ